MRLPVAQWGSGARQRCSGHTPADHGPDASARTRNPNVAATLVSPTCLLIAELARSAPAIGLRLDATSYGEMRDAPHHRGRKPRFQGHGGGKVCRHDQPERPSRSRVNGRPPPKATCQIIAVEKPSFRAPSPTLVIASRRGANTPVASSVRPWLLPGCCTPACSDSRATSRRSTGPVCW